MAENREREKDLLLTPRQFAFTKDTTKGNLVVCVGPYRTSLTDTDRLVIMDKGTGQLRDADQKEAIQPYVDVVEGEYVVLTNPAPDDKIPEPKKPNDIVELRMGRQVNLPGPKSFALWPFQTVKVIKGHRLQLNEFLLVRVLNDAEALKNWSEAVIKPQVPDATGAGTGTGGSENPAAQQEQGNIATKVKGLTRPESLSVGQLLIIQGTEVSFYIPPTGMEVVPDENDPAKYVREAETLEQLEYCVLVDQRGEKRYIQGPNVVFPKPSETFVTEGSHRKFKAIELTEISGIHIKVTAPYTEGNRGYKPGEELFITGEDKPIYFPRAEHAIIKYGDTEPIHFSAAVPKGEGRYVLNRKSGEVLLVKGPKMLLPDPRSQVIVRRILTERQVLLWYPNNAKALEVNRTLATIAQQRGTTSYLAETSDEVMARSTSFGAVRSRAPSRLIGDQMERSQTYTPPRTITLDTKYDGAVQIDIWTGFAVLLVDKTGKREVVEGPETILLEFDQSLAYMELSSGKPKSTDNKIQTAFLRVKNNRVSDIITVETADMVKASVKVSYRVDFEGDKNKWFNADNYVKLLCDHARSRIQNMVKKHGIESFNAEYIDLIRDTILGVKEEATQGHEARKRPGMAFAENGMRVYDVEVLGLDIGDSRIGTLLVNAQHQAVENTLTLVQNRRRLDIAKEQGKIDQEIAEITTATELTKLELEGKRIETQAVLVVARLEYEAAQEVKRLTLQMEKEKVADAVQSATLARERQKSDQTLAIAKEQGEQTLALTKGKDEQVLAVKTAEIKLEIERLLAESTELAKRADAVKPDLIAALQGFGNADLLEKVSKAMAPLAILGGESVSDILGKLLKGSGLEGLLSGVASNIATRVTPVPNGALAPVARS